MNTNDGPPNDFGTRIKDIVLLRPPVVLGTGENYILFYFRYRANNGTGIPCEGIVTDLLNSTLLLYVHQLVFSHMCLDS